MLNTRELEIKSKVGVNKEVDCKANQLGHLNYGQVKGRAGCSEGDTTPGALRETPFMRSVRVYS